VDEHELIKKAICNMCFLRCGINADIKSGKISKVTPMQEHPHAQLCPKAEGLIEWVYSPERITHPLRKINGKWEEVSWDEALGFVSDKLFAIKETYGGLPPFLVPLTMRQFLLSP